MSDDDKLEDDVDEIESTDDSSDSFDDADAETGQPEVSESYEIPSEEDSMSSDDDSSDNDSGVTQAEVYENLKRIGELEDEKQKIQEELRDRTDQLRGWLGTLIAAAFSTRCFNRCWPTLPQRPCLQARERRRRPREHRKRPPRRRRKRNLAENSEVTQRRIRGLRTWLDVPALIRPGPRQSQAVVRCSPPPRRRMAGLAAFFTRRDGLLLIFCLCPVRFLQSQETTVGSSFR